MMAYGNGSWGWMVLEMLLYATLWIALIGLLIWAVGRWLSGRTPAGQSVERGAPAMEILRARYARGEVDEAAFERMRQQLEAAQPRDTLATRADR